MKDKKYSIKNDKTYAKVFNNITANVNLFDIYVQSDQCILHHSDDKYTGNYVLMIPYYHVEEMIKPYECYVGLIKVYVGKG